jgi:hypothetical protein
MGTPVANPHQPKRPQWTCRLARCGKQWPCPGARVYLAAEYAGRPTALAVYMSGHLVDALADLGVDVTAGGTPPDGIPPGLYNRFMGWVGRVNARTQQIGPPPGGDGPTMQRDARLAAASDSVPEQEVEAPGLGKDD